MNVLAFDTATEALSVAVLRGEDVVHETHYPGTGHARLLLPEIERVLARARLRLDDIQLIGVGVGPGSFTGVRIGVSAAQAIAYARSIPVIGVSTLAAMTARAAMPRVLAMLDARMGEVYAGFFDWPLPVDAGGVPRPIGFEIVVAPTELAFPDPASAAGSVCARESAVEGASRVGSEWQDTGFSIVGPGFRAHASDLARWTQAGCYEVLEEVYPSAFTIARLARTRFELGEEADALALRPSYVRSKVASKPKPHQGPNQSSKQRG